jgi:RecB family exonuclease
VNRPPDVSESLIEVGPRDHSQVEAFDPYRLSASRIDKYLGCGVQFKRNYIDGEKPVQSGSAALFGSVMHLGLEKWALNREHSLVELVRQAWLEETRGTSVLGFIEEYQAICIQVMKAEKAAADAFLQKNKRETKAARMTKHFKESKAASDMFALVAAWEKRLNEGSPWKFTERDPLPSLYDESLILAKRYSRKWRDLPTALHSEFGFTVPWKGFHLRGFIDAIEPVVTPEGELRGYGIVDYKTYRQRPAGAKDHRQGVIYYIAFKYLTREGVLPFDPELPVWVIFDYVRLLERRDYVMSEADEAVLFTDALQYSEGVKAGIFLPAQKNGNPDFCDYPDCCLRSRGEGTCTRGDLYPEEDGS